MTLYTYLFGAAVTQNATIHSTGLCREALPLLLCVPPLTALAYVELPLSLIVQPPTTPTCVELQLLLFVTLPMPLAFAELVLWLYEPPPLAPIYAQLSSPLCVPLVAHLPVWSYHCRLVYH